MCPEPERSQRKEGREIGHPELLSVLILLPPPPPEAGGLHGGADSNLEPSQPTRCTCWLGGLWGLHLQAVVCLPHPRRHPRVVRPLWSICAGLLFAYASAGQVTC